MKPDSEESLQLKQAKPPPNMPLEGRSVHSWKGLWHGSWNTQRLDFLAQVQDCCAFLRQLSPVSLFSPSLQPLRVAQQDSWALQSGTPNVTVTRKWRSFPCLSAEQRASAMADHMLACRLHVKLNSGKSNSIYHTIHFSVGWIVLCLSPPGARCDAGDKPFPR